MPAHGKLPAGCVPQWQPLVWHNLLGLPFSAALQVCHTQKLHLFTTSEHLISGCTLLWSNCVHGDQLLPG